MLVGAVKHALSGLKCAESSNKKMLMIVEHGLVMDSIAETLDLLTNFSFRVEVLLKCFGDGIMTKISVLNRSWVAISIFHFPFSLLGFEILVSHIVQLDLV